MSKNILVVADFAAPYEGSFMESLKRLEKFVKANGGGYLYCLAPEAVKTDWIKNFQNVCFFERNLLGNIRSLNDIIRKNKIDIIYTHFCETRILMAINVVKMMNPRVKVIEHFRNHYDYNDNPIKRLIKRIIYSQDGYIGCSEGVAKSLPFKKDKVHFVTNCIYFPRLDTYEEITLGKKGDFKILMMGRPYRRKGIDLAIRAIQKLNNPKIKLFISLSTKKDEFEKGMIADFGEIPSFVTILEPRNDVATYYRNVDLFVSAAREEGFCNTIPEAMYCGTPVISSDIDGIPNDIPDLILFESENVDELSKAINSVYDNKNKFNKKKVKKYLEDNYSADIWAKKVLEILS